MGNTSISNTRLKLAKNQANDKQHPEAKILLFKNHPHSSGYHPKTVRHTLKAKQKNNCVCINHNENDDENEKQIP